MFKARNKINIKIYSVFHVCLFFLLMSKSVYAIDESIYYGQWQSTAFDEKLCLILEKNTVVFKINDKKINSTIMRTYTYSKISPVPFLSIVFDSEDGIEHSINLILGDDVNKSKLLGYYEKSIIIDGTHGELRGVFINLCQSTKIRQP